MPHSLSDQAIDQLFLAARTQNKWQEKDVPEELLRQVVELARMGPTSANCQPARFFFIKSKVAKQRLKPFLSANNAEKTMAAPVCTLIAYDLTFYEHLPHLFPHNPAARGWFEGNAELIATTALRNSSLQGAYLIIAARALGLECGPMSGFDNAGLDKEFFPEGRLKSNFLCSLGYGDPAGVRPRGPRFSFDDMAKIL